MESKHLHIVALDVPYPPNYGGAMDMYFRIKSLAEAGVKITLHCFEYGRGQQMHLDSICEKVYYYPRHKSLFSLFNSEPYIVSSRRNSSLFDRLFADKNPVLLEGLHTTACLTDSRSKSKDFYVRTHNIEHEYYRHLAEASDHFFKKMYYKKESKRLEKYEPILKNVKGVFAISEKDTQELSARYTNVKYLPPFIPNDTVDCKTGKGEYALYHGNLAVEENQKAVSYLLNEVFNGLDIPLVIAGNGANKLVASSKNIKAIESPTSEKLTTLITNAHVNVLPTFQSTGIKLKLINSLFRGRFCLVNMAMVMGSGVEELCVVAEDANAMKQKLRELFKLNFPASEIEKRKEALPKRYSNKVNANILIQEIFEA